MYNYLTDAEKVAFQAWKDAKDILPLEGEFKAFIETLARYDWSYSYSDDSSVWRSGEAQTASIIKRVAEWSNDAERAYLQRLTSKLNTMQAAIRNDFSATYRDSLLTGRVKMAAEGVDDLAFDQFVTLRDELVSLVNAVPKPTQSYLSSMGFFINNKKTNYALMRNFAVTSGDQRFYGIILTEETRNAIVAVIKFMETKYWRLKNSEYIKLYDFTPSGGYKSVMPTVYLNDFRCYADELPEGVKAKTLHVNGHTYSYVV